MVADPLSTDVSPVPSSLLTRALITGAAVLVVFAVVPGTLILVADGTVDHAPCVRGDQQASPPDARFFRALDQLETAAVFPGFGIAANRRLNTAVLECTRSLANACREKRDPAREHALDALQARGWRVPDDRSAPLAESWRDELDEDGRQRLCEGWTPWMEYLREADVPPATLCPVCTPVSTPDHDSPA